DPATHHPQRAPKLAAAKLLVWRNAGGIYGDEQSRTQTYYIVSRDNADGALRLRKDRVHVEWPGYSADPSRIAAEAKARDMIEAMGGTFQSNPFALRAFGGNRVIAHPLGGAGMGAAASDGVTAHDGRVFDPSAGDAAVHDGLYVTDAAAIPGSVGVSPLLTISGLAERAMMLLAEREGRALDVEAVPAGRPLRDAAM
ncbi:MAG: GMC oxidoreductase, partial [Pseudomonadota bacterium]